MTFAKKVSVSGALALLVVVLCSVTYALLTQPDATSETMQPTDGLYAHIPGRSGEPSRLTGGADTLSHNETELSQEQCVKLMQQSDFFVDTESQIAHTVDTLEKTDQKLADELRVIACKPQAFWLVGKTPQEASAQLEAYLLRAKNANKIPIVVLYNAPEQNSTMWQSGIDTGEHTAWVHALAEVLAKTMGNEEVLVVLEPDALALAAKYNERDKQYRLQELQQAVHEIKSTAPNARLYLDAGHSAWLPEAEVISLLTRAGIDEANGVSLNTSNYQTLEREYAYAKALYQKFKKPAVIDTSRNGVGPGAVGVWCNAKGRALGAVPQKIQDVEFVDALLWIKRPGESDGTCNGGPKEGALWISYAQELIRNMRQ